MFTQARLVALALLIAQSGWCVPLSISAQTAADKPSVGQERPLKLRTDEVLVDAVVLDKKSHAVSDLAADDLELERPRSTTSTMASGPTITSPSLGSISA